MKVIGVLNGWREVPSCWWRYLLLPFGWDSTPAWFSVSVFGFVVFFRR